MLESFANICFPIFLPQSKFLLKSSYFLIHYYNTPFTLKKQLFQFTVTRQLPLSRTKRFSWSLYCTQWFCFESNHIVDMLKYFTFFGAKLALNSLKQAFIPKFTLEPLFCCSQSSYSIILYLSLFGPMSQDPVGFYSQSIFLVQSVFYIII